MPEDQARLRVLDDRARGKVLQDEVVHHGGVSGRDVQEVVRASCDVEHLDHTWQMRGNWPRTSKSVRGDGPACASMMA